VNIEKVLENMKNMKTLENCQEAKREVVRLRQDINVKNSEIRQLEFRIEMLENPLGEPDSGVHFPTSEPRFRIWDPSLEEKLKEERKAIKEAYLSKELLKILNQYPNIKPELKTELERLINMNINTMLSTKEKWPEWFKKHYSQELENGVERGLDQEFTRRVEIDTQAEINRRAHAHYALVDNWITRRFQILIGNQLRKLSIDFDVTCDKCGNQGAVSVTPDTLAEMLVQGKTSYLCANSQCKDFFSRHGIPVTLGQVVQELINREPVIIDTTVNKDEEKE
jgi:hypothetical protein